MSTFAFKTPVQIARNGDTVSLVDAESFIICNMEEVVSSINLRDAGAIRHAINNHEALTEALSLCFQALSANESTLRLTNNWGTAEREAERTARRALGHFKHDTITKDTSVR